MKKRFFKLAVAFLAVCMLVTMVPVSFASAAVTSSKFENAQLDIVSNKESVLASGVTLNSYTVYDKNGDQVKMFVTKADMSVDSVKLYASYKDMNPSDYGLSKLSEQVAGFNKLVSEGDEYYQGTVVAGINASYYNMQNGKPTGAFVMNGIDVTNESEGNSRSFFAVLNDGSVMIGGKGDYSTYKGQIREAIGGYYHIVKDGAVYEDGYWKVSDTKKYPRQTLGITADGDVILMTADGSQAPISIGLTLAEQAQVMVDLGCVEAIHLDGGGSATYSCKPEGSDEFVVTNSPSDGGERSVSNGFIIVSTAVASYEFDRVAFSADNEYLTPGTAINVAATGVSSTGNSAEIPEDVTYVVENGTYANGVFTAAGKTGEATITAMRGDKAVGSITLQVVIPDKVQFAQPEIVVPFGKTVDLNVIATYGIAPVVIKTDDVRFDFGNDAIGTVDGFSFTAAAEGTAVTNTTVTVTVVENAAVCATANITLGKGSDVIADFEDGTNQGFKVEHIQNYNYMYPNAEVAAITADNGKVRNGSGALKVNVDFSNSTEAGYMGTGLGVEETITIENALTLGMWIYVPEEAQGLRLRACLYDMNNTRFTTEFFPIGKISTLAAPNWYYVTFDISKYPVAKILAGRVFIEFYCNDRDDIANYGYNHIGYKSLNTDLNFYIDDITIDYSSAIDDREAPIFETIRYADKTMPDAAELGGKTVSTNVISFSTNVVENTSKNNYTGINAASAKAYVDGVEVPCTLSGKTMAIADVTLADGKHTVKFVISDNMGNTGMVEDTITVKANSDMSTVKIVPHDATLDKILLGSVYYVDLVATDIETVKEVEVDLDLNNMSVWELDHMVVAEGFDATYTINSDDNTATVIVTRTGVNNESGEGVLVSMPIRTWELPIAPITGGTKVGQTFTYVTFKKGSETWPIDINVIVDRGIVTYLDNTTTTFTGDNVQVDTESYVWDNEPNKPAEYASWNGGHDHRVETAKYYAAGATNVATPIALADKAATCTEDGYTDRTYCEVCKSVVKWGTTIPATGHTYEIVDGVLGCACGELFNGVHTDGNIYIDGVVANGWVNDSYYVDGVAVTGVQLIDGYYYNFGENGVCANKAKYTGLFYDAEMEAYRYSKVGVLTGGWQQIGDNWHYFGSLVFKAVTGKLKVGKATFTFDETGMTEGAWFTSEEGTRFYYGPSFYRATNEGYMKLVEIDGVTYNFNRDGYITPGVWALRDSTAHYKRVFEFAADGSLVRAITEPGVVKCADAYYYINAEGVVPINANLELVKVGSDFYYVLPSGKVAQDSTRYLSAGATNGLVAPGEYTFGADGKMDKGYTGIKNVDGVDYYYFEGEVMKNDGGLLVEFEGDIYYVTPLGKIKKSFTAWIAASKANGLVEPGNYTFGADGKMETPFTGIKNVDSVDYYYVNGQIMTNSTGLLVEFEGDIYYVTPMGKIKKDFTAWINATKANGLVEPGNYTFGADGKMETPYTGIKNVDGVDYYYVNGQIMTNSTGLLVEWEGDIYYVTPMGKIKKDFTAWINATKANGLVEPGNYTFGADGKMEVPFTGIKNENGTDYYYLNGAVMTNSTGLLVEFDGDIYYVTPMGKIKKDFTAWINATKANGIVEPGNYTFDADGKMVK